MTQTLDSLRLRARIRPRVCSIRRSVCGPFDRRQIDAFLVHFPERREFAQLRDLAVQQVDHEVDFLLRREAADREADRAGPARRCGRAHAARTTAPATPTCMRSPDDTATSLIAMISDSPSTKLKLMLRLCGTRRSMSPFTYVSSICDRPRSSLSRSMRMRSFSVAISSRAIRNASPMPTIWCVASVPERMPRSWPPPCICASMRNAACGARTARRCPSGRRSCAPRTTSGRPSASRGRSRPCRSTVRRRRGTRCPSRGRSHRSSRCPITPISLFTCITDTRIVSGRSAALNTSRSIRPSSFTSR